MQKEQTKHANSNRLALADEAYDILQQKTAMCTGGESGIPLKTACVIREAAARLLKGVWGLIINRTIMQNTEIQNTMQNGAGDLT